MKKLSEKDYTDACLLVVDPADIHIGKLASSFETGEDYNNQIAVNRVKEGVDGILRKSSGFNIDQIVLVVGNDILHIDTPRRTTTSGTPQDTDGMWYENFLIAKKLYIDVIDQLMKVADVHIMYNPSNHDYTNGFFLADAIKSWYKDCENVSFDVSISHRKYYQYGNSLIGIHTAMEQNNKICLYLWRKKLNLGGAKQNIDISTCTTYITRSLRIISVSLLRLCDSIWNRLLAPQKRLSACT